MNKISDSHIHAVLVKIFFTFLCNQWPFFQDKRGLISCFNNLNFAAKTVFWWQKTVSYIVHVLGILYSSNDDCRETSKNFEANFNKITHFSVCVFVLLFFFVFFFLGGGEEGAVSPQNRKLPLAFILKKCEILFFFFTSTVHEQQTISIYDYQIAFMNT